MGEKKGIKGCICKDKNFIQKMDSLKLEYPSTCLVRGLTGSGKIFCEKN